ncbi:hypothetical protein U1Q18_025761 [Sarracenia purpurea var. burkii]
MGANYYGKELKDGVIPKVVETIFTRTAATRNSTKFLIKVFFVEIFNETVYDLLAQSTQTSSRADGVSRVKPTRPASAPIQIRETGKGQITLTNVTEAKVGTKEEMTSFLVQGLSSRAKGSTKMNNQSRAIYGDGGDNILRSKLLLVDLAGSERVKQIGAEGLCLQQDLRRTMVMEVKEGRRKFMAVVGEGLGSVQRGINGRG